MPTKLERILDRVSKPARYTGGEYGSIIKNPADAAVRFAFCFPDVYDVGMSHLGLRLLYHLLNEREDTYCERVFSPWPDMAEEMKKEGYTNEEIAGYKKISLYDEILINPNMDKIKE
mgnify:CR=1 FL=1